MRGGKEDCDWLKNIVVRVVVDGYCSSSSSGSSSMMMLMCDWLMINYTYFDWLTYIPFRKCVRITDAGVMALDSHPSLRLLDIVGCVDVTGMKEGLIVEMEGIV